MHANARNGSRADDTFHVWQSVGRGRAVLSTEASCTDVCPLPGRKELTSPTPMPQVEREATSQRARQGKVKVILSHDCCQVTQCHLHHDFQ